VGGNPDLDAETAKVWTTGVVYEPTFAEGLGISVDYFNVKIENSIQSAGASILLANCYNLPPGQNSDCDKIIRDPNSGIILSILDTNTNIGANETDGVDFNINYAWQLPSVGRFRHNFEGTWLHHIKEVFPSRTVDGVGVYDLADGGEGGVNPRWKFNLTTLWGYKELGLGANARYIHSFRECDQNDCQQENADMLDRKVDINVTADAFATYSLKSPFGASTLTIGVNNVTDQEPPVIFNGFLATSDSNTYDFLGRFFYARLTQAF